MWEGKSLNRYFWIKACRQCGGEHLQDKQNAKKSKENFCNMECRGAYVKAQSHGSVSKRQRPSGGHHVLVRDPSHPRAGKHGQVYEHILIAEKKLGRPIEPHERVHHINCVMNDNRPDNLFVCGDNVEHLRIHATLNHCVAELIEMGTLVFDPITKSYVVNRGP